jgi:transposase-like protein
MPNTYIDVPLEELAEEVTYLAPKPFKCCPCGSERKSIIGVTKTDVVYKCPRCGSSWLRSERCQMCGEKATQVIRGFGICDQCK